MMHAVEERKVDAIGQKSRQVVPRKKFIRRRLKKICLHTLADWIVAKLELGIDGHRPALSESKCRPGFHGYFEIARRLDDVMNLLQVLVVRDAFMEFADRRPDLRIRLEQVAKRPRLGFRV